MLVFFDDILVYNKDWLTHHHLQLVFEVLCSYLLRSKCSFGQKSIGYLGHIVSAEGISMEPTKIEAILSGPIPRTLKASRGFLGLAGYYRKFIKNFREIAASLMKLTKKDSFVRNSAAQEAFQALKHALSHPPVLAMPDFTKPFVVECDALGRGLGAVWMRERPVAFLRP